ncbi:MAG: phosphotransferase [Kitasatospora sp.]|nr:phosphotransferase [Kitasatospora sp.]
MTAPGGVGLYSIGVRGLGVPQLLQWAAGEGVPFVHLRGGPRGVDLVEQGPDVLAQWRRAAQRWAPVTGVTADLDLTDLFAPFEPERARARAELERLSAAAAELGAGWVRLLGRAVPKGPLLEAMLGAEFPQTVVPLLVELHHPDWLAPETLDALEEMLGRWPRLRLLADTTQLAAARPAAGGDADADAALERVLGFTQVLHLSDDGTGLDPEGRELVAERARRRIADGRPMEVAVEWTGQPRTPQACLSRYRNACRLWAQRADPPLAGHRVFTRSRQVTGGVALDPQVQPELAAVLAGAYNLTGVELERLPVGQVTVNYRARIGDQVLFVKHYQDDTDLGAEQAAVDQTQLAGLYQVPVATPRASTDGDTVVRQNGIAVSVWDWVPGTVVENGLNPAQQRAAGHVLGRIHTAFADHPAGSGPSARLKKWMNPDLDKLDATTGKLLGIAGERAQRDAFDEQALRTLAERRAVLPRIPELLAGLPALTTQVLHGDYSAVNLLFQGDELTAVLDFLPPDPFLIAYELGRIAFDPRTVVLDEDWIAAGANLAGAYLQTNPNLPAADVTACARVALLQLLTSLYGVKQHYLSPGLIQEDLDQFWLLRHAAATRLLENLDDVEHALTQAAHHR